MCIEENNCLLQLHTCHITVIIIHFATLQVRNNRIMYNKFLQTTAQSWWLLCPLRLNAFSLPEYKKETKLVKFNAITLEMINIHVKINFKNVLRS